MASATGRALLSEDEWLAAARRCLGLGDASPLQLEGVRVATADADADVAGFMGETLPVVVTVRQGGDDGIKELPMFFKIVPRSNAARARMALTSRCFLKETGMYAHVFPRMEKALGGRASCCLPRCFFHREDLLLMEDLRAQGFHPKNNRQALDEANTAVALEALAAFHAASMALEDSQGPPSLEQRYQDYVQENMFTDAFPSHMNHFITSGIPGIKHLVGLIPKYRDSHWFNEILKKIDDLPAKSYELVKASSKYRNVICHGDLWIGNVLFRYSPTGEVLEARFVDFQMVRYCPPALDVASFLFLSMRRDFREAHTTTLLSRYHAALLRAYPPAASSLPRDVFDASYKDMAAFGRIIAAGYLPADLLPRDVLRPLVAEENYESYVTSDRSAIYERQWHRDAEYRAAVQEVVEELVDGLVLRQDAWDAIKTSAR